MEAFGKKYYKPLEKQMILHGRALMMQSDELFSCTWVKVTSITHKNGKRENLGEEEFFWMYR